MTTVHHDENPSPLLSVISRRMRNGMSRLLALPTDCLSLAPFQSLLAFYMYMTFSLSFALYRHFSPFSFNSIPTWYMAKNRRHSTPAIRLLVVCFSMCCVCGGWVFHLLEATEPGVRPDLPILMSRNPRSSPRIGSGYFVIEEELQFRHCDTQDTHTNDRPSFEFLTRPPMCTTPSERKDFWCLIVLGGRNEPTLMRDKNVYMSDKMELIIVTRLLLKRMICYRSTPISYQHSLNCNQAWCMCVFTLLKWWLAALFLFPYQFFKILYSIVSIDSCGCRFFISLFPFVFIFLLPSLSHVWSNWMAIVAQWCLLLRPR